jgi:divalent metal cation (Fe/Co/Zn/Cd) transporter
MKVMEVEKSYIPEVDEKHEDNVKLAQLAMLASWITNIFLLIAKAVCVIISSSKCLTAALVDSIVDLISQGVMSLAERYMDKHSPDYPVGRSRLECLSGTKNTITNSYN